MNIKSKILSKSNQYNYYKKNFLELKDKNEKLIKKISFYEDNIKKLNDENTEFLRVLDEKNNLISSYKKIEIIDKICNGDYENLNISIKTPNPKNQHFWGEYFYATSLKKYFERLGFNVVVRDFEDWYLEDYSDIVIVLRGPHDYKTDINNINILWDLSRPFLSSKEYEKYDICFIASYKQANILKNKVNTVVEPLLQCTDPEIFFNEWCGECSEDILFVGSTRGVYRDIVRDVMQADFDVSIYGMNWNNYVDEKFIKDEFIPNNELHKYYSSCNILLNDHWDRMRDMDYPSNRLFDALACGAFIISDDIAAAKTIFKDNIVTYKNSKDLNDKIKFYLENERERKLKAKQGQELVLKNHTFENRVKTIIDTLKNFNISRG